MPSETPPVVNLKADRIAALLNNTAASFGAILVHGGPAELISIFRIQTYPHLFSLTVEL